MRITITILLSVLSWAAQATNYTATVSGGNVNATTNAQTSYGLVDEDSLSIPGTANNYVGVGNIQASPGHWIYVIVPSRINIAQLELRDLTNVKVICRDGSGYGIWSTGYAGRAFLFNGVMHNVYVQGVKIDSCTDFPLYATHTRTYDGSYGSMNTNITFDHIWIHKTGIGDANAFSVGGGSNSGGVLTGIWDTVTINNCKIDSAYGAQGMDLYSCFHVRLNNDSFLHNGGIADTNDVAMVYLRGQMDTAQNIYISDCWGKGFRLNGMALVGSKASSRGDIYIYNSIIVSTRKYPTIECNNNNDQYDSSSSYLRPCNYHILYCTLGACRSRQVAGQGSVTCAYTHGGGTISYIGCIMYKAWVDNSTQTLYNKTFYNGDGSGAVNDSTGTVYDSDGTTYLSDTAHGVSRVDMPGTVTAPYQSFILSSFNGNTRPTRGYWRPGAYSFDGIDSGGSPVIKRKNRLLINKL